MFLWYMELLCLRPRSSSRYSGEIAMGETGRKTMWPASSSAQKWRARSGGRAGVPASESSTVTRWLKPGVDVAALAVDEVMRWLLNLDYNGRLRHVQGG